MPTSPLSIAFIVLDEGREGGDHLVAGKVFF
jgi:hypothetical protein